MNAFQNAQLLTLKHLYTLLHFERHPLPFNYVVCLKKIVHKKVKNKKRPSKINALQLWTPTPTKQLTSSFAKKNSNQFFFLGSGKGAEKWIIETTSQANWYECLAILTFIPKIKKVRPVWTIITWKDSITTLGRTSDFTCSKTHPTNSEM